MEGFRYRVSRHMRWYTYYYDSTMATLSSMLMNLVYVVLAIRLTCNRLSAGWVIRTSLEHAGLADKIRLHQQWYQRTTRMFNTDPVLWKVVRRLLGISETAIESLGTQDIALTFVIILVVLTYEVAVRLHIVRKGFHKKESVRVGMIPFFMLITLIPLARGVFVLIVVPVLGCVFALVYYEHKLRKKQRQAFRKNWKKGIGNACVGPCASNICACISANYEPPDELRMTQPKGKAKAKAKAKAYSEFDEDILALSKSAAHIAMRFRDSVTNYISKTSADTKAKAKAKGKATTSESGKIGIACDDNDFVQEVNANSAAHKKGMKVGDTVVQFGNATYSKDALASAQRSGDNHKSTVNSEMSRHPQAPADPKAKAKAKSKVTAKMKAKAKWEMKTNRKRPSMPVVL